jgi:hypothetical protein
MSNKKYILPYGDALRDFLNDSGITKSDLRSIIRQRGVFVSVEDKSIYVPLLVRTGLTPLELAGLHDNIKIKEENPKRQTQSITCKDDGVSLMSSIPAGYSIEEVVKKPFSNYRVLGVPSFKAIDGNSDNIELDFTVERYDYTQTWDKNTTQFSGKVKFNKKEESLGVDISLSHTSQETKEVANKIVTDFIKQMKSNGHIDNGEVVRKILFKDFTNENRIKFLRELSQNKIDADFYFTDTKDVGFCPDESEVFPDEISWMQEKVSNLILQGKDLHSTFFIKNKSYHKYLQVHKIDASYAFQFVDYSGTCKVSFEFPDFIAKQDLSSELIIRVSGIRFKDNLVNISQSKMKEILLSQLEKTKLNLYEKHAG